MAGKTFYVDGNGTVRQIKKIYFTNSQGQTVQIKTDYYGTKNTFSSAHNVTYNIDVNNSQVIEIDDGLDVIVNAPTATKSGWTFRGWREDTTATPTVVSSKACDRDGIIMYAVFQRTLTISYNGNGATSGSTSAQTGTQYYNNNRYANPTFTLRSNGFAKANSTSGNIEYGYSFANWRLNSGSGTAYNPGTSYTASSNVTFYAYWNAYTVKTYLVLNGIAKTRIYNNGGFIEPGSAATCAPAGDGNWLRFIYDITSIRNKTIHFQFMYTLWGQQVVFGGTSVDVLYGNTSRNDDFIGLYHDGNARGLGSGWAELAASTNSADSVRPYFGFNFGEGGADNIIFNNVWID